MICGIGTDIVQISRLQKNLAHYGDRFAQRILSESEFEEYLRHTQKAHMLAKRFAAKEAAVKALGTGFAQGISLRHITVTHNSLGQPRLQFEAEAKLKMQSLGVTASYLSIADEKEYAVAFVVLEK